MWNSTSSKNRFCAITPRRYSGPPELCSFQAKLVSSSERCPRKSWPFTQLFANVASGAPALPDFHYGISHCSIRFPVVTLVGNFRKHSILKRCLAQLPPIMTDATSLGGVFPLSWRPIRPPSWVMEDEAPVKHEERPTELKTASSPQRQPLSWRGSIVSHTAVPCACILHKSVPGIF